MERLSSVSAEVAFDQECIVLVGERGAKIALPVENFEIVSAAALQRANRLKNREAAPIAGLLHLYFRRVQTLRAEPVLTTEGQTIALLLDHGLPTQQSLSLDLQTARDLIPLLQEAIDQALPPQRVN